MTTTEEDVVRLESAQQILRDHFLGWQCRLRQHAVRHLNGRPSPGMCPDVVISQADVVFPRVVVVLLRQEPATITAEWRHMIRRTKDPKERYDAALKYLSASYYQDTKGFSDRLFAVFAPASAAATRMRDAGSCELRFEEKRQSYHLPCRVERLAPDQAHWQAAFWHNSLFNPNLPGDVEILAFQPDWSRAQAEPPAF